MNKTLLALCFIGAFSSSLQSQKLSKTERKIIDKVQSYDEESVDFLEKVVNINSGTMNLEGVKAQSL